MNDFDTLNEQGLAERGDLLGDTHQPEPDAPVAPVEAPRLDGQPEFPQPGIYFGMPEETYHAINACSSSAIKHMAVSSMDCWANSNLNPDREDDEKKHLTLGKAIHCLTLEGEDAYTKRFAVELTAADVAWPILMADAEIKAAISKHTVRQTCKPKGRSTAELQAQLDRVSGGTFEFPAGMKVTPDVLKEAIALHEEDAPVKPVTMISEVLDGEEITRPATKDDRIAQLLALEPDARVWDRILADHLANHAGKTMLPEKVDKRVRIAARMIFAHPELATALTGGYAEVSVFWYCPKTGAPMKARFDYLKTDQIVDLKSFANKTGMPVDRAIERTIANYRYNVQQAVYVEAAVMARGLIGRAYANGEPLPVFVGEGDADAIATWCLEWAQEIDDPSFMFIFQQTGVAPVTRGKIMPHENMGVFGTTVRQAEMLKARWAACCEVYGTDPWLDIAPVTHIEDEAIPMWATDL